jgi:ribosomal protein L37E
VGKEMTVADASVNTLVFVAKPFLWIMQGVSWVIALPIRIFTWVVVKIRVRTYDPEKVVCPACGFRGDSGTSGRTCRVKFIETAGSEKAALQHICFRCGNDKWASKLYAPAEKWMMQPAKPRLE